MSAFQKNFKPLPFIEETGSLSDKLAFELMRLRAQHEEAWARVMVREWVPGWLLARYDRALRKAPDPALAAQLRHYVVMIRLKPDFSQMFTYSGFGVMNVQTMEKKWMQPMVTHVQNIPSDIWTSSDKSSAESIRPLWGNPMLYNPYSSFVMPPDAFVP